MSFYEDLVEMGRELHALTITWTEEIAFTRALTKVRADHDERDDFEWATAAEGVLERVSYLRQRAEFDEWRCQNAEMGNERLRGEPESEAE